MTLVYGDVNASLNASEHNELELVNRLRNLFQRARDWKRPRYDNWHRNYRLVHNRMGTSASSNWMPSPRDSEIYPILSSLVAWMSDQHVNIDCTPFTDPHSPYYQFISDIANDLSTVMYSNWVNEHYDAQVKLALWDGFQYGAGILKCCWDNALAGGQGNAVLRRTDPWAFYVDPNATSLEDMEYCVEVRRMSLNELERRHPNAKRLIDALSNDGFEGIDEKPNLYTDQEKRLWANMGTLPQSGQWPGSSPGAGRFGIAQNRSKYDPLAGIPVYEFWIKENSDWFEQDELSDLPEEDKPSPLRHVATEWRVVVMAANRILMDERASDLWGYGSHPYERWVFDDVGEFYGIALVDHLAYPQIYINRLLTSLQYNAELTGNPIFLEGANSGLDRVGIINKPGQRLRLNGAAAMQNRPDWLKPPEMPKTVTDLVQFWISRLESTSGLSAIVKGATPTARNAEGVISSIQEAAFVRVRAGLANLEMTLQAAGIKLADLITEFYTERRLISIVGPEGTNLAKTIHGKHFYDPTKNNSVPLKFGINIQAGANLPTSRQARIAEADKLFGMGAIDDQALLEAHQYPRLQAILKRKYDKQAAGIAQAPGARQRARRSG